MRRLINTCWTFFKWGCALLLIAALTASGYLYFRLDEEIRRYAQQMLAEQYPQLQVSVGGARFVPGRGVTVFDVSLAEPPHRRGAGPAEPLVHLPELTLAGKFEMRQLLEGAPVIDRVIVRRPRLTASRRVTGEWRLDQLLPLPEGGKRPAPIEIIDGTLVVIDEARAPATPLVVRNVAVTTEPVPDSTQVRFQVTVSESIAKRIEATGHADRRTGAFSVNADFTSLRIDDQLLAAAPVRLPAGLRARAAASGVATVSLTEAGAPLDWRMTCRVEGGSVAHPSLPRPLAELSLTCQATPARLAIRDLNAKCGAAEINAAGDRYGWSPDATARVQGRVTGLPLDRKLYAALPGQLRRKWDRFQPEGVVDVAGWVSYDGSRLQTDATIDCRGLSVTDAEHFPYRLRDVVGTLHFHDTQASGQLAGGQLEVNLRGSAGREPVVLSAHFYGLPCPATGGRSPHPDPPGTNAPCPVGWVDIKAPRVQVSPALIAALAPHQEASMAAQAFAPTGDFGMHWRMERPSPADLRPKLAMELTALDLGVTFDKFPYPLRHVTGQLVLKDGVWTIKDFKARQAKGPRMVTGFGTLTKSAGRGVLQMRLQATAMELDEPLRAALRPEHQDVWARLRPEGRIDATADITYVQGEGEPQIVLYATPHQRSVSIEPTFFRYRLDRLDGRFVVRDGRVTMTGVQAEHGRTELSGDGAWTPTSAGGWRMAITNLQVDYLDADHDLRLAAPLALRRVIDELRPEGSFGVHDGRITFDFAPARRQPLWTGWDVWLDCHQSDVNFGVRVEGVTGSVRLAGSSDGDTCRTHGQLDLDTLFWNGLQLTKVRGPVYADAAECRLGRGVADTPPSALPANIAGWNPPSFPAAEIAAEAYGGAITVNTRVLQEKRPRYAMAIGLQGVDLERFSRDYLHLPEPVSGRVDGRLSINGAGVSLNGVEGEGSMELSNATLYELPVMVALLKVLRNRTPDTTAFDGCRAEFTLAGPNIEFSQLDLLGDAVSLKGRGATNLDRELNLTFHTVVGRGPSRPRLLRSLMGQASEQILRLRVTGPANDPMIQREALPVVGNVLEQFRNDLQPQPLTAPAEVPKAAALRRLSK
ncbi:MAG: AsmA-like C-terminal region-containing protein [Planctomycetota bacterium]